MIPIEIRPEARIELHEAFGWYEEKEPGLGFQFLFAVGAVIERIRRQPRSGEALGGAVRKALLRRFPYAVAYEYDGERIIVFAVYHGLRRPKGWSDSVSEPTARHGEPTLVDSSVWARAARA